MPRDSKAASIRIKIDVTGNGDWKDVQDVFDGNLTLQQLFTKLKEKPALQKFLNNIPLDRNIQNKKLKDISKSNIIELAMLKDGIHLVNKKPEV